MIDLSGQTAIQLLCSIHQIIQTDHVEHMLDDGAKAHHSHRSHHPPCCQRSSRYADAKGQFRQTQRRPQAIHGDQNVDRSGVTAQPTNRRSQTPCHDQNSRRVGSQNSRRHPLWCGWVDIVRLGASCIACFGALIVIVDSVVASRNSPPGDYLPYLRIIFYPMDHSYPPTSTCARATRPDPTRVASLGAAPALNFQLSCGAVHSCGCS